MYAAVSNRKESIHPQFLLIGIVSVCLLMSCPASLWVQLVTRFESSDSKIIDVPRNQKILTVKTDNVPPQCLSRQCSAVPSPLAKYGKWREAGAIENKPFTTKLPVLLINGEFDLVRT